MGDSFYIDSLILAFSDFRVYVDIILRFVGILVYGRGGSCVKDEDDWCF